jgi:hypothetical protein
MNQRQYAAPVATPRERELEIEVARLNAELEALRDGDETEATSRFLAMAAATVDRAVEDARREADGIVEEVSAQAEARRDEATRVAVEAEALAARLLAEAERAQEVIDHAAAQASAIRTAAAAEAVALVSSERVKVEDEMRMLTEVRGSLEAERGELESYHEELRRRAQDLAESMMTFMTMEPPIGGPALENFMPPQLQPASDDIPEFDEAPQADVPSVEPSDEAVRFVAEAAAEAEAEAVAEAVVPPAEAPPVVESIVEAPDSVPEAPEASTDEVPGAPDTFADVALLHDGEERSEPRERTQGSSSSGLFARAVHNDNDVEPLASEERADVLSLFGVLSERMVDDDSSTDDGEDVESVDSVDSDDSDDRAFRQFLDGDDAPDRSRDWLLRPEQS